MKEKTRLKLIGLGAYLISMLALQQVIIIPIVALLLILVIYKAKSEMLKSHAKYIMSVYIVVTSVVLITANLFHSQQQIYAALVAVSIAFLMLMYGALRVGFFRKPLPGKLTISNN